MKKRRGRRGDDENEMREREEGREEGGVREWRKEEMER